MSVLIKGLKMPMGCYECPFEVWGKCMFIHYNVSVTELKSCPLVEVSDKAVSPCEECPFIKAEEGEE